MQRLGPAEGPPVVLVHGLLVGNLAGWFFTVAPELAETRPVILYDLRGHGLSERPPTGYDVATLAEDLSALTEDTPGPLTLVGHSYGGLVALHLARTRPERVERLALLEAPLPPSRASEFDAFLERSPEEMLEALPDSAKALMGRRRGHRLLRTIGGLVNETTLLEDLRAERDVPDAELARVAQPALCLYGTRSACAPVADRLERTLPDAEVVRLDAGHYLHLDQPEAVARHLKRFVVSSPPPTCRVVEADGG